MRGIALAAVALAAFACGGDTTKSNDNQSRAAATSAQPAAQPSVELPPVDLADLSWDACGDYGARVGSWVRELGAAMTSGQSALRLSAFATELSGRLGAVNPSPEPLAAAHAGLVASVTDFSEALSELADATNSGDAAAIRSASARLDNGADNIELAAAQVVAACE